MKSINKTEALWNKINVENLDKREEYTSLSAGCCWNVCCWNVCCWEVCCYDSCSFQMCTYNPDF